jgi:hypothetical protein
LGRGIPEQTFVDCGLDVERSMDHEPDEIHEPTSIARCRELLGEDAEGLTDREVDQIRRHADALAHVIVELYLGQRSFTE